LLELNRIYNIDCLEGMQQLHSFKDIFIITDPPYGDILTRQNGHGVLKDIAKRCGGDKWDYKPSREYFDEILSCSERQVIFGGNYFTDYLPPSSCWIVWDKNRISAKSFSECELAWTSFNTAIKKIEVVWDGFRMESDNGCDESCRVHPTQKPVKLFEWIIKNYAKEGDIICDPFFGSGSCLVAAIRLGYQFIGFEKEKVYFDAAQIRIKKAQEQGKISEWF
jgi:site-specific DNA-methyltransferase (adenine-specific)